MRPTVLQPCLLALTKAGFATEFPAIPLITDVLKVFFLGIVAHVLWNPGLH